MVRQAARFATVALGLIVYVGISTRGIVQAPSQSAMAALQKALRQGSVVADQEPSTEQPSTEAPDSDAEPAGEEDESE